MAKKKVTILIDEELESYVRYYASYYNLSLSLAVEHIILNTRDKATAILPKDKWIGYLIASISRFTKALQEVLKRPPYDHTASSDSNDTI